MSTNPPSNSQPSSPNPIGPQYWKTHGYPAFSRYLASGSDFLVLRKFGQINALVLLDLQNEIRLLEQQLEENWQQSDQDNDPIKQAKNKLTSLPDDHQKNPKRAERSAVLKQLRPLIKEYNELLISSAQIRTTYPAQEYQINSLRNWHNNYAHAIFEDEQYHKDNEHDLICLGHRPKPMMMHIAEKSRLLRWLFRKPPKKDQYLDEETQAWSSKKMQLFADSIAVLLGLCMLYGPLWWLNWVSDNVCRLGIVAGFVGLFAVALVFVGGGGRPFEVLAATAAYAAVLMVFLQQGNNPLAVQ